MDARSTHVYRRLISYVRPYRLPVALASLSAAISAGAAASYAYLIGPLLKGVLTGSVVQLGPFRVSGGDLTFRLPLLVVGVASVKALAQLLQGGLMQTVGQKVMADLRRELYGHLLRLPPRFFEERHSGELLSRFTSDVAQVEYAVSQALSSYVKDTLQILALLGVCFALDVRLFALAFVVLPGAAWPVATFARTVKRLSRKTQASLGQLALMASEQLHNLPVVQTYGGGQRALEQFDTEQEVYLREQKRSLFVRGAFTPVVEVLGLLGVALAIGGGASAVFKEPALASKLLSFLAAALLMYQPLKALSGTFALVMQGMGAAERLFEVSDAKAEPDVGEPVAALGNLLEAKAVFVSHDGSRLALAGASFRVRAGEKVAMVGESGAGKTTAFSALLRLAPLTGGCILWDGRDIHDLKPSALRNQVAWVSQEPVLFSGTVRQNLLWGKADANDQALWDALRSAHAEDFVQKLPGGLDEQVGERGSRFSGGQRQRLAIARAFVRKPSLLLLDEPTSALDAESEEAVQKGLKSLLQGRTALVIAHRLSTVKDADRVYVFKDGKVVEEGTHEELTQVNGHYAALLLRGELAA